MQQNDLNYQEQVCERERKRQDKRFPNLKKDVMEALQVIQQLVLLFFYDLGLEKYFKIKY